MTSIPPPITLDEINLPAERAAPLLAVADGLCRIGFARTGVNAGQFSIFNFLLRCAEEPERRDAAGRDAYVLMMQAGIVRRRAWYCRYWPPSAERPLQIEAPAPLPQAWEWWSDIEEITRRLRASAVWGEVIGEPIEVRTSHFREALDDAVIAREVRPS